MSCQEGRDRLDHYLEEPSDGVYVDRRDRRYIINFDRAKIFGAGVGHHSPVGGYLEAEDLVFVLDVYSDYQPWLVELSPLFTAMATFDGSKGAVFC